ncbi:hypothetical protein [Colwellia sp. E150_009]
MNVVETGKDIKKQSVINIKEKIKIALKPYIKPRNFKAYCVGTAKSGTHSVAAIFNQNFRSRHEPNGDHLIYLKNEVNQGRMETADLLLFLKNRDIRNNLHMESSDFAGYFVKEFIQLDSDAKFILPIRDCYSFLDSIINHQINNPVEHDCIWKLGRDLNYNASGDIFSNEEVVLNSYNGLYPIKGYLQYWAKRNIEVLNQVSSANLLVFKTSLIKDNLKNISQFLGISTKSLNINSSHSFKAPKKHNLLSQINTDYIEQLVIETGCQEVMKEFFPEKTIADVLKT